MRENNKRNNRKYLLGKRVTIVIENYKIVRNDNF